MQEERNHLLYNLLNLRKKMIEGQKTYSQYILKQREFRAGQKRIGTTGVKDRAALALITIFCTIFAFYLLLEILFARNYYKVGFIIFIITFVVAAPLYIFYKKRNQKSLLKPLCVLWIAFCIYYLQNNDTFFTILLGTIFCAVPLYVIYTKRDQKSLFKLLCILWLVFFVYTFLETSVQQIKPLDIVLLLFALAIVVAAEWFFITRKNKEVDDYNQEVAKNNQAVRAECTALMNKYERIVQEMQDMGAGWYPPDYYNEKALKFFINAVNNYRAQTVQEMVNLFEQDAEHQRMLEYQQNQARQMQQLIASNQSIQSSLIYANMVNTASLFQQENINAGVQQINRNISNAMRGR